MDLGLKGKRALICGGSKGLGQATVNALAAEGADVFVLARDQAALATQSQGIKSLNNGRASYRACDLLNHASREEAIKAVNEEFGGVDILIHNVGGPKASFAEEVTPEDWQAGFDRLFQPVVDFNRSLLPGMKERGWGRIVVVTSLSVIEPIPMLAISNSMRSAVTAMCKTLADEVAGFGVTINCVAPGMIQTDRTDELLNARSARSGKSRDEFMKELLDTIPAKRLGTPEEYAAVVCFLCSEQASYVTGSTICVDGGKRKSTY